MSSSRFSAAVLMLLGCGPASKSPNPPAQLLTPAPVAVPADNEANVAPTLSIPQAPPSGVPPTLPWLHPDHATPASMIETPGVDAASPTQFAFSRVALPDLEPIGLIAGPGPTDVWLVSTNNDVYRYDGHRGVKLRKLCPGAGLYPPGPGMGMRVRPNDLLLFGLIFTGESPAPGVAVVPRSLPKECAFNYGSTSVAIAENGEDVWRYEEKHVWSLVGASLPAPILEGRGHVRGLPVLWVGSQQHAYLAISHCDKSAPCFTNFWEYRGVSWIPRPPVDFAVRKLWVDEYGAVWALGSSDPHKADGHLNDTVAMMQFLQWGRLAVPQGFRASEMVGQSRDNVWFYTSTQLYFHEGSTIRTIDAPIEEIATLWLEPSGAPWIGGSERSKDRSPQGVVVRAIARRSDH